MSAPSCSTSIIDTSTRFITISSTSKVKKRIFLLSDNPQFIHDLMQLIAKYTQTVDPRAPLKFNKIKKIKDPDFLKNLQDEENRKLIRIDDSCLLNHSQEGLTHRVDIHDILPRSVAAHYGKHFHFVGNCHGSALMASGLFPLLTQQLPPLLQPLVLEKMKQITVESIDTGDLVFLGSADHSFVFLSHEICLSTNGCKAPLEIQRTTKVLQLYNYPSDALTNPESLKDKKITILRKHERENCYEEMMPSLQELTEIFQDLYRYSIPQKHPKFSRLHLIEQNLRDFTISVLRNDELPKGTKNLVESIYFSIAGSLPFGFTEVTSYEERMNMIDSAAGRHPRFTSQTKIAAIPKEKRRELRTKSGEPMSKLHLIVGIIAVLSAILFYASLTNIITPDRP